MSLTDRERLEAYHAFAGTYGTKTDNIIAMLRHPGDPATKEDLAALDARMATKDDLAALAAAIKEDLAALAAATKEDLAAHAAATKNDLAAFAAATKDDLAGLASVTQLGFATLQDRMGYRDDAMAATARADAAELRSDVLSELYSVTTRQTRTLVFALFAAIIVSGAVNSMTFLLQS